MRWTEETEQLVRDQPTDAAASTSPTDSKHWPIEDLAIHAAGYIAGNLIGRQLLVGTDPKGYELALALAAAAGPGPARAILDQLRPLVEYSIDVGQDPPKGWEEHAGEAAP